MVVLDLDRRLDILAKEVRLSLVQGKAGYLLVVLDVTEEESLRASKEQFFRVWGAGDKWDVSDIRV